MKKIIMKMSYYRKILLALLVVNLVPTLFLGGSVFNLVQQQKQTVNRNLMTAVESQMKRIENNFQHMENSLIEMSLENDMAIVLRTELSGSNFQIFNNMRRKMQLIWNSIVNLDEILLFNQEKQWIIGTNVCSKIEDYPDDETIEKLYRNPQYSYWSFDEEYIYLVKHLPVYTAPGTGIVAARFYKTAVDLDEEYKKDGSFVIVLDEENRRVTGEEEYYTAVRNAMYSKDWENMEDGRLLRTRTGGHDVIYKGWITPPKITS